MKRVFATIPMLWPRLSDRAAMQLLDIMSQLLGAARHHYGPQARRWQREQARRVAESSYKASSSPPDDDPF